MRKTVWTDERRQELVRLYQSGMNLADCCRTMKAGQVVVMRELRLGGVQMRPACKQRMSQDRMDQIVAYYQAGHNQSECCRDLGIATGTLAACLRQAGLEFRAGKYTELEIDRVVELYALHRSVSETARQFGTTSGTVRGHLRRRGVRIRPQVEVNTRGETHWNWKGGRCGGDGSYVYVHRPDHPHASHHGYVLEHRLVMEEHLGRLLLPREVVHHKNKNRSDNRLENLQLFSSNGEHLAFELKGQVPKWTEEGKARIAEGIRRRDERRHIRSRSTDDAPPSP